MKQKIYAALIGFLLMLIAGAIGGGMSGYVRAMIAETQIASLDTRMDKAEKFRESMSREYVPRLEYEKDYRAICERFDKLDQFGIRTNDKLDKILLTLRNGK